jgi:hypothetical protein
VVLAFPFLLQDWTAVVITIALWLPARGWIKVIVVVASVPADVVVVVSSFAGTAGVGSVFIGVAITVIVSVALALIHEAIAIPAFTAASHGLLLCLGGGLCCAML